MRAAVITARGKRLNTKNTLGKIEPATEATPDIKHSLKLETKTHHAIMWPHYYLLTSHQPNKITDHISSKQKMQLSSKRQQFALALLQLDETLPNKSQQPTLAVVVTS